VADFNELEDFLPQNSLMVAPIPTGAGMKVKVAETLSMGLPIAGSDEALVGYEDAIRDDKLHAIIRANSVDEYVEAINLLFASGEKNLMEIEIQNQQIFCKHYSFDIAKKCIENIMTKIIG